MSEPKKSDLKQPIITLVDLPNSSNEDRRKKQMILFGLALLVSLTCRAIIYAGGGS